ncbi:OB-fold nucleic acid binding domain-containing protein [Luteipulveratus sp. YIM 133132]|uniref:OB-fold nucleic acid binding domain-containing protein n=2 Tax=Luteipulveratus flavus TaxID=3031728 RepID=A0ABT6CCR6_9MICO|nr:MULTISPECIES: OB-fold nucleic acid binding domain-containing protein [unclassified Luteipulveratus]MDE9366807.1 OB-fold nucleic acid binding domain-containing protein [Luteipulveratus sp. YIM 133132]MDF8265839.1 OB-fold nucleic acid binding domain-containing protein [Luteipulveratus sp. YIM 133296]
MAHRLTRPQSQIEAEELRERTSAMGGTPICDVCDREMAQVCGTVRSVSLRPRADHVPALVVDLDDGSRSMRLVWLGRRKIAGIAPGTYLKATGRVAMKGGVPTIFNPSYELKAR